MVTWFDKFTISVANGSVHQPIRLMKEYSGTQCTDLLH